MHVQIITFNLKDISEEEYRKVAESVAPAFTGLPGLISKHWLADAGTPGYAAGDMWGCVGSWYSGDWHSPGAQRYVGRVRADLAARHWLEPEWPEVGPSCSSAYGCPGPGRP